MLPPGAKPDKSSVTSVLSFMSKSGSFCRQYRIVDGGGTRFSGVGCRAENGDWRIQALMPAPASGNTNGKTVPASGSDAGAVEHLIDGMITGDVFGVDEEAKLIAQHWSNGR